MKINQNLSFEAMKGLISRSNTDERLCISDEWLRANKAISIPQYQSLRELWNDMVLKYGSHKIIISCGSVKHTYATGLSFKQAKRICKDSHWTHNHNNGCEWDMEIEEDIWG